MAIVRRLAPGLLGLALLLVLSSLFAQAPGAAVREATPAATMSIEEYEPKSTLVVPGHLVPRAKYPFIDVHNHQDTGTSAADAATLVREMDEINLRVMVNLSGGQAEEFVRGLAESEGAVPEAIRRLRQPRFLRDRRSDVGTEGGDAARARRPKRRAGAEDLQELRHDGQGLGRPANRGGRSARRSGLGEVRRARDSGADPHGRAEAVLRAAATGTTSGGSSSSSSRSAPGLPTSTRRGSS